jgi:hypothetical protein
MIIIDFSVKFLMPDIILNTAVVRIVRFVYDRRRTQIIPLILDKKTSRGIINKAADIK